MMGKPGKKVVVSAASGAPAAYRRVGVYLFAVSMVALAVRLMMGNQSLWYDEIYTYIHFIRAPWTEYSPNNQPPYTLAAWLTVAVGGLSELSLRLPSILAGAAVGIVLAWPMRTKSPLLAVSLALAAALQPWLVTFSGEARGYALLLLLCAASTQALPMDNKRIAWAYAITTAAAVYTVPIAVILCVGHGVAMIWLHREGFRNWLISITVAALLTLLLYANQLVGMWVYFSQSQRASVTYRQFLQQLWPTLLNGWNAPAGLWLPGGVLAIGIAGIMLAGGCALAWRKGGMKVHLVSFGVASALAMLLPMVVPAAAEMRFVLWLIPLYIIGMASMLAGLLDESWPGNRAAARASGVVGLLVLGLNGWAIGRLWAIPAQPMRDALALAEKRAAPAERIVGVYMGAVEAREMYAQREGMNIAYAVEQLRDVEVQAGGKVWLVVFYPGFMDRDLGLLATYIQANYQVYHCFPGRVSEVIVLKSNKLTQKR